MCATTSPGPRGAAGRFRWGALYGGALLPLAVLAVVEVAAPPGPLRTVLRCVLALGTFAAMALWVRSSRAAFDLESWCACAPGTIRVRVIESRRPLHPAPVGAEERELAHR